MFWSHKFKYLRSCRLFKGRSRDKLRFDVIYSQTHQRHHLQTDIHPVKKLWHLSHLYTGTSNRRLLEFSQQRSVKIWRRVSRKQFLLDQHRPRQRESRLLLFIRRSCLCHKDNSNKLRQMCGRHLIIATTHSSKHVWLLTLQINLREIHNLQESERGLIRAKCPTGSFAWISPWLLT